MHANRISDYINALERVGLNVVFEWWSIDVAQFALQDVNETNSSSVSERTIYMHIYNMKARVEILFYHYLTIDST